MLDHVKWSNITKTKFNIRYYIQYIVKYSLYTYYYEELTICIYAMGLLYCCLYFVIIFHSYAHMKHVFLQEIMNTR